MFGIGIFKERAEQFAPYFATFYYVEIIYFMGLLLFAYGRFVALCFGFSAAFFVTFHIIRLYRLNNLNRIVQLIMMDIHLAYSSMFFINRIFVSGTISEGDIVIMIFRFISTMIELPLIFALTDLTNINKYRKV